VLHNLFYFPQNIFTIFYIFLLYVFHQPCPKMLIPTWLFRGYMLNDGQMPHNVVVLSEGCSWRLK